MMPSPRYSAHSSRPTNHVRDESYESHKTPSSHRTRRPSDDEWFDHLRPEDGKTVTVIQHDPESAEKVRRSGLKESAQVAGSLQMGDIEHKTEVRVTYEPVKPPSVKATGPRNSL